MSSVDEVEYFGLMESVLAVEKLLHEGGSGSVLLGEFVKNARERMEHLEAEGLVSFSSEDKKKKTETENLAVAFYVQHETRLSAAEKQQYGSFLEKDFFTRSDFDELDKFYASAWDRLTDEGKAQMSHRVWEGVRASEYQFTDLPSNVKEKEAAQIYAMLAGEKQMPAAMRQIPVQDKQDFISAMDEGDHSRAFSVLNRKSFKETVSLKPKKDLPENSVEEAQERDSEITFQNHSSEKTSSEEDSAAIQKDSELEAKLSDLDMPDLQSPKDLPKSATPFFRGSH